MKPPTGRLKIFIALLIYLAAVIVSVNVLNLKRESLQFHQRDYNYFVEQAARLTDPRLSKSFAMQIEGYNFLGLQGIEGVKSLYHAIHTEYFRYLYVLLYGVFRDPLALYIVYSLLFFSPILYFAFLPFPDERQHTILVVLFSLLYVLFPATLNSVTSDLRPRMLFASAWSLLLLSIYFDRPFWEKLLFFLFLVGIREEGIILGAIAIGLNYLKLKGRQERKFQTVVLLVIDASALALFLAFMWWGGYTRIDAAYNPINFIRLAPTPYMLAVMVFGATLALFAWWMRRKSDRLHQLTPFLLCYSLAIGLTGFQWLRDNLRWASQQIQASATGAGDIALNAVTNETTALVFYLLIVLGLILWGSTQGRPRRLIIAAFSLTLVLSTAITLIYYPPWISKWRENVTPASLVWDFAATHDRYETKILVDYDTYQAFYNFDQVIVYNRLPLWNTLPEKRYYPANKDALVKQIQKGIQYAVIGRESLGNVLELAEMAGVPVNQVASNDHYVILGFQPLALEWESIARPDHQDRQSLSNHRLPGLPVFFTISVFPGRSGWYPVFAGVHATPSPVCLPRVK